MSAIRVNVTVRNPVEPQRCWQGEFLVDTAVHETVVPRKHLEAIGIEAHATRLYKLADGSLRMLDIAGHDWRSTGTSVPATSSSETAPDRSSDASRSPRRDSKSILRPTESSRLRSGCFPPCCCHATAASEAGLEVGG